MEDPTKIKETILSTEQKERQEKFVELSDMMSYVFESLKKNQDSKAADEAIELVKEITQKLKDNDLDIRDFLAGKILLNPKDASFDLYSAFDTEDNEIEKIIDSLFNKRTEIVQSNNKKQPK
jgi:TRAP-type mannitol/chloroaromatic compound transport system substrate-binding protein